MKKLLSNSILGLLLFAAVVACNKKETESKAEVYYCPMHPTVKSSTPGVCPVCNMDLVAMNGGVEEGKLESEAVFATPVFEKIISQAKTTRGRYHESGGNISAEAWVDVDRRNAKSVSTLFSGRVESAEARYLFQKVIKGQVLFTVYSPELVEAQRNHLLALRNSDGSSTRKMLQALGLEEDLIRTIESSKEPLRAVPVRSPISGILIPNDDIENEASTSLGNDKMNGAPETMGDVLRGEAIIRTGEKLTAGTTIVKIAPLNEMRVYVNIPASAMGTVDIGDPVYLSLPDEKIINTTVESIEVLSDNKGDFIRAKTSINLKNIQPGTILKSEVVSKKIRGLWIPRTSAQWLGQKTMVFIKDGNGFVSREVEIGRSSTDSLLVKQGLSSMDEIAIHAGMLQDGDTFIKH